MSALRPTLPRTLVVGGLLVLVGLVSWALYGLAAGSENRSYHANAAPPRYVTVERGHTYWLAVPNGVQRLQQARIDAATLRCTAAAPGAAPGALDIAAVVTPESDDRHLPGAADTKFVNRIASFVARRSGRLDVRCDGIGTVYVENAAGSGFDWSGLWLVLATAALVAGLPLTLSGLRRSRPLPVGTGEQHEVE